MGCDIHLFVEHREHAAAPWRPVLVKTPCRSCTPLSSSSSSSSPLYNCHRCNGTKLQRGYHDRNYLVFSILAGVRNHDIGILPIAPPRGLPADLSPELQVIAADDNVAEDVYDLSDKAYGAGWFGDHSFSWLTLAELNAYDRWGTLAPSVAFVKHFLPALRLVGAESDVRIIFGFDS